MKYVNELASVISHDNRTRMYYDGSDRVEYVCEAKNPKTLLSIPEWRIKKFFYSGVNLVQIVWANGTSDYVHIVDSGSAEYASYTYTTT